jgi:hypothetical protein
MRVPYYIIIPSEATRDLNSIVFDLPGWDLAPPNKQMNSLSGMGDISSLF